MYQKRGQQEDRKNEGLGEAPRRRGPPRQRQPKEHITVTIDTVIPPAPEKHELLAKPNWTSKYQNDYVKLQSELDSLKKERVC
jgi:hypothetical protein